MSLPTKVKLTVDLPIDSKHKAFKGSIFEVQSKEGRVYMFKDADGETFGAYRHEFEYVKEK